MYQRKTQTWIKHLDFIMLDMISLVIAFFLSYYQYNHTFKLIANGNYRNMLFLLVLLDILVAVLFNTMHNVLRRSTYEELKETLKQVLLVLAIATMLLFAMKMSEIYSRLILSFTAVYHCLLGYLMRVLWKRVVNKRALQAEKKSMVLVCSEKDVERVLTRSQPADGAEFSGVVLTDRDAEGEVVCGMKVVANVTDAAQYICREWVDEVLFFPESLSDLDVQQELGTGKHNPSPVAKLLNECRMMAIPIHIRIPLGGFQGKNFIEKVNGFNVVTMTANYASPLQMILKRLMDILGGLVGSVFAVLIILIIGPIVKIKSPGPILFRQERIGLNGKRFKMIKLRSMYMDAEERKKDLMKDNRVSDGMMFKLDFDPRIIGNEILPDGTKKTGIGEFIRRTSLDEFPQFFNVLKGDMSLVGTRPPTVDEWEKYEYHHRARLTTKPGITGMWQVSGRSKITDFEEVVKLDTEYITNWSFWLDLKILAKTVVAVFRHDGAM